MPRLEYGARLNGGFTAADVRRAIDREITIAVQSAQKEFTDHVRFLFRQPKHGKVWFRADGSFHRASAPGEAPAVDTGKLNASIRTRYSMGGKKATVTFNTRYASYLENGTTGRTGMQARPYAQVSLDHISPGFVRHLGNRLSNIQP